MSLLDLEMCFFVFVFGFRVVGEREGRRGEWLSVPTGQGLSGER
jgi:hypothetical protein